MACARSATRRHTSECSRYRRPQVACICSSASLYALSASCLACSSASCRTSRSRSRASFFTAGALRCSSGSCAAPSAGGAFCDMRTASRELREAPLPELPRVISVSGPSRFLFVSECTCEARRFAASCASACVGGSRMASRKWYTRMGAATMKAWWACAGVSSGRSSESTRSTWPKVMATDGAGSGQRSGSSSGMTFCSSGRTTHSAMVCSPRWQLMPTSARSIMAGRPSSSRSPKSMGPMSPAPWPSCASQRSDNSSGGQIFSVWPKTRSAPRDDPDLAMRATSAGTM
mmetsp:Transcript_23520/g.73788  ORF Transcript_23520/g.73788 Transcript_23520/m.73788 type:complete len:289 (-) Transcript_23520:644-1510(-)